MNSYIFSIAELQCNRKAERTRSVHLCMTVLQRKTVIQRWQSPQQLSMDDHFITVLCNRRCSPGDDGIYCMTNYLHNIVLGSYDNFLESQ